MFGILLFAIGGLMLISAWDAEKLARRLIHISAYLLLGAGVALFVAAMVR
jgi:hypothetical protein